MSDTGTLETVTVEHDGIRLSGNGENTPESLREAIGAPEPETEASSEITAAEPEITPPAAVEPPVVEDKRTRGQKRFDELTREREEAKRDAERLARERDDLRRELEAARRPAPVTAPAPEPQKDAKTQIPVHLKGYDAFLTVHPDADYEDFRDARTLWLNQQQQFDLDARIRSSIEADRASRQFQESYRATHARALQTYPDFDAVIQAATVEFPRELLQEIAALPGSEHVQYRLAKDETLARRIASLPPVQAGLEIAKLILPAATGASPASPVSAVPSTVPAPYQPVGAGRTTTVPSSLDIASDPNSSYDAFSAAYDREHKRKSK